MFGRGDFIFGRGLDKSGNLNFRFPKLSMRITLVKHFAIKAINDTNHIHFVSNNKCSV